MDIRELNIGDWVYNTHHGRNIRLTAYDFFTHVHINDVGQLLTPFSKPSLGRDLEPVPLTPEILEKNEFVIENGEFVFDFYNGTVIIYNRFDYNLRIVENYKTILDIKYYSEIAVHELQHALRLCKILKEIVL